MLPPTVARVSCGLPAPLVVTPEGFVVAALDAAEEAPELEAEEAAEVDALATGADEEAGALDAEVPAAAADEDADDAGAALDELELEPPTGTMTPPCTLGELSEVVVLFAFCW